MVIEQSIIRIIKAVLLLVGAVMLSACAASMTVPVANQQDQVQAQNLKPGPQKALVYVIRDSQITASAVGVDVYANLQRVGSFGNGAYLYFYSGPGNLSLMTNTLTRTGRLNLNVEAGKTYFVMAAVEPFGAGMQMALLSDSDGRKRIAGSRLTQDFNRRFYEYPTDPNYTQRAANPFASQNAARPAVAAVPAPPPAPEPSPIAVSDIEQNLPQGALVNNDAIAVVIGNRNYKNTLAVKFALNDAKAVKQYLVDVLNFKEGNIFLVEDASKGDFERFFGIKGNHRGKLHNAVKPGRSDVFVFYSGHGAPGLNDHKGYFVPVEADPNYLELEGYSVDVFYENVSKLPARSLTVVLDACFSGANVFDNISPIVVQMDNPVVQLKNGVVLSSSSGSQVSSWYNEKGHGMFTYFFLKAIHNKNADANRDNQLTFEEIYKYVSDNSDGVPYYARREHGIEQNPTIEGQFKDKVLVQYH